MKAKVHVFDAGDIRLDVWEGRDNFCQSFTPNEADRLALELIRAATRARDMAKVDAAKPEDT